MKATLRTCQGEKVESNKIVDLPDDYDGDPYGDKVPFAVGSNQQIIVHDADFPGVRRLTIKATLNEGCKESDIDEEDDGILGEHAVEIESSGDDGQDAGRALDEFHNSVAVANLDPFVFSVWDGDRELIEDENYEGYSYKG